MSEAQLVQAAVWPKHVLLSSTVRYELESLTLTIWSDLTKLAAGNIVYYRFREEVESVFEERAPHNGQRLELCQRERPLEQLPLRLVWTVRVHQLLRLRQEVELVFPVPAQ